MKPAITLLGGGLLGRVLALFLAENGYAVTLYDRGSADGDGAAAYVAAAMLAPMAEAVDATPQVIALGKQSLPMWEAIIDRLPEKVMMQQAGSLIVWHPQDKDLSTRFAQHLRHGNGGREDWENWDAAQIAAHEAQLAGRFAHGFYLPGEGQLDNRQTLSALAAALRQRGVTCHWHSERALTDFAPQDGWLIDCRGYGAKQDWNAHGTSRLRGIRGEVARVYAPEISLNRPVRLLHPRYPLYIAPKENHVFVIGATQIESEDLSQVSVRSSLELMSALYAVHPAFGEARVLEFLTQLRPTLDHHDPEIRVDTQRQIMSVNGLFRHGFMIAPAVAAAAMRLLAQLHAGQMPQRDEASGLPLIQAA
ncbi:MAG: FAD-dependent oxidoreductase [Neisseria sp.]|nr:FAD-dependent oxidoreductase [Neisseria sp.]